MKNHLNVAITMIALLGDMVIPIRIFRDGMNENVGFISWIVCLSIVLIEFAYYWEKGKKEVK